MASSLHKTPDTSDTTAKASKASTANSSDKAASGKSSKSMETEQIQAEKAGAVGPNPTGQRAMNKLASEQGSYSGGEGRQGMNAAGGAEVEQTYQGTTGEEESGQGALLQNIADSVAKLQADIDVIKSGLNIAPANLTGPGVTGPADYQIKPQRIG